MKIQLLRSPGCPHAEQARELVQSCVTRLGLRCEVEEFEGEYPSPTIRINGTDVMGPPPVSAGICRLDLPTEEHLLAALRGIHEHTS